MKNLYIFVIHNTLLKKREPYINKTLSIINDIATKYNYKTNVKIITQPSKEYIEENIKDYNERVDYKKENIPESKEFDDTITSLNVYQISNIEKHRIVYNLIYKLYNNNNNDNDDNEDLYLILEDDAIIGEEYIENLEELFKKFNKLIDWDILFTCITQNEDENIKLVDIRKIYKLLLCKSSYFIKPKIANRLEEYLKIFKYSLKNSISKYIYDNKDIKAMTLNKHIFMEGSKMGLFLTSVNNNNFLFQNNDYIKLAKISNYNKEDLTNELQEEADRLFKKLDVFKSADIYYIYGIYNYKLEYYRTSKKYLLLAVENMKDNEGLLTNSSEILNNCINMHQYDQIYLEECKKLKSKYE